MSEEKEKSEIEKFNLLVKRVFSTQEGEMLLELLADEYIWSKQLHPDPYVLASRIGVQELITHLISIKKGNV